MSTQLKLRRGTTAQHSTFTGASGEVTVDTDKKTLVVHDGTTAGGQPLLRESQDATVGNITISGTGKRFIADFSNATLTSRAMLQTSSAGYTNIHAVGNGAGNGGGFKVEDGALLTTGNSSVGALDLTPGTDVRISSTIRGAGTYLPMTFYTGGSKRVRLDPSIGLMEVSGGIYNSSQAIITAATTLTGTCLGTLVEIGASASGFTITLPNPTLYNGGTFQIWLNNTNDIVLSTPSGNIYGPTGNAAATQTLNQKIAYWYTLASDGYNWALSATPRIDSNGSHLISSPTAGLGYGTGAGGTVTQATSKSTAVTLNKPTGQITMNSAALAANSVVGFTFNNSLLTASDVLLVQVNGGATGVYNYTVAANTGAGNAGIYLRNISGGSLSEAVVINFAIIKGATA